MSKIESYPIFEADQVLTNNHLNDTVNYLERQSRLSRTRLIGNGIVCGLDVTVTEHRISISDGHGITSQGYLIEHCQQEYTHYADYVSPEIPGGLNLFSGCNDTAVELPYYGMTGVLEMLPPESPTANKKPLSTLKAHEYVVALLLEAKQVRLKNCDTNDCNDKGGRLDFEVKPLLVRADSIVGGDASAFDTLLLKRYGVPRDKRLESGEQILDAFYDIVDDDTLRTLSQNLWRCWDRYAPMLGLAGRNPFEKFDLIALRGRYSYQKGNFHYIQYFYDFIDDLIKALNEFKEKAQDFLNGCGADERAFPLHLLLGLASESTQFGHRSSFRQYFVPVHHLYGQRYTKDEVALLLQRLKYMATAFDLSLPAKSQPGQITPTYLGKEPLSDRCIPFYYQLEDLGKWWSFRHYRQGNEETGRDTQIGNNALLYDIERFNAFRIEGHIGKRYAAALSEIIAERDKYNLPFDVVALSAVDLQQIANGNEIACNVQDLESDYNVLIAGLLCRLEQLLKYVGGLRPERDRVVGDLVATHVVKEGKASALSTFSNKIVSTRKNLASQRGASPRQSDKKVNYIAQMIEIDGGQDTKLMDFVTEDIHSFLIADRKWFEYVLPKPDLLLVFLQQLNAIFGYLFEHDLRGFDADAYHALWTEYESTVNSIIKESANSQNEELKDYFAPKNNNVLFNCANEELYAIKGEYNERLERYQEAVTFATYFERHRGLEHKAGVPKGGTFILVYQPPAARYSAIIPETELRLVAQPVEAERSIKAIASADFRLGSRVEKYMEAVSLIENLGIGADASKVLEALKTRGEKEKQVSELPEGVVIADFYVPYMCTSNCPPIAYVFPASEAEPPTPEEPDENVPTVSIAPTVFCADDKQKYAVKITPEGGKLTINGKESGPEVVPAKLGSGSYTVVYTLESGAVAQTQFLVQEAVKADFEIAAATYSVRESNWEIILKSTVPDIGNVTSEWSMDGETIVENQLEVKQLLTPNNPKATMAFAISESVCGVDKRARTFVREEHAQKVHEEAKLVTIPVETTGVITLVMAPKGVSITGNALTISPAQLKKEEQESSTIAYYYPSGDQVMLAVLTVTLGTAAFEVSIGGAVADIVTTRRTTRTAVNIILRALSDGGTSTWTINGKAAKATTSIPIKEFEQLKELAITHRIEFGDGFHGGVKTFTQPIASLKKQLETGKGKITVK